MKRASQIGFLICFLGVLAAVPLFIALRGAQNETSYYENRMLAALPEPTRESLLDGSLFSGWDTWLSDHISGRERLLSLNTWVDYQVLGKPMVSDVVTGSGVLLPFQTYGTWDLGYLDGLAGEMAEGLSLVDETVSAWGGSFYYLGLPTQSTYFSDRYPAYLENRAWHVEAIHASFSAALEARGLKFLDMAAVYEAQGKPEEYYAASDHHFTYLGAFAAYQAMMDRINADQDWDLPVLRRDEVTIRALENPFLGSRNRKLYGRWIGEEHLLIGEQADPVPFVRLDNGGEVEPTLYTLPDNVTADVTYDIFMGGDKAETILRTDRPELPNLLIFGDSFTNPLETLFYTGFNETRSLDLRHYSAMGILEYLEEYQPDVVLCIRDDTAYLSTDGNGNIA